MKYPTKSLQPPNLCMECGTEIRRPKRFCDEGCKDNYLRGRGFVPAHRGIEQVNSQRRLLGITPESLEWRRKRNVNAAF